MSTTRCTTCGSEVSWSWEEAFDKFGFDDGGGLIMTEHVAEALREADYTVEVEPWGCHNIIITSIKLGKPRREQIPAKAKVGYDAPRDYLPRKIVKLLDATFSSDTEVEL